MNLQRYQEIVEELKSSSASLVAVSKTKPAGDISILYEKGQRLFGENKAQEMSAKYEELPKDIAWHFIGHLQTNKVKYIAPFVSLIHSVDSLHLLEEINRQGQKSSRVIPCLLQIYIASEETKFGLDETEAIQLLASPAYQAMQNISIQGLMGMATNTENKAQVDQEFEHLRTFRDRLKAEYFKDNADFKELSMGMSADYQIALKHGATLVRIGSEIFGGR